MPLLDTIHINEKTQLYIWKVTETIDELLKNVFMNNSHKERYDTISNETQKKNFLATRATLKNIGYDPDELFYDEAGKPFLKGGKHISISHSFDMVAVIIGEKKVGVDIEKKREKIISIARKFTQWDYRTTSYSLPHVLQKLTMIWTAKESGFKIHGNPNLTINDVMVKDFFPNDTSTQIKVENSVYTTRFMHIEDFVLTYSQE